jgi:hypothetical protein
MLFKLLSSMATMMIGMPAALCRKFAARSYALYSKDCNGLNPKSIPARIANISKRQIERLDRNAFLNTIGLYIASWEKH